MNVTFTFAKEESITVDLDPRLIGELHDLLSRQAIQPAEASGLLRQIAYFERNRDEITDRYPGLTVVLAAEDVAYVGTEDEAFAWAEGNPAMAPVYIVNLQAPDEQSTAVRRATAAVI
jgi:hypothetical protein